MSCLSSDPPKIRLGVGGSGGSQEIRRPLQRSSVWDDDGCSNHHRRYRIIGYILLSMAPPINPSVNDTLGGLEPRRVSTSPATLACGAIVGGEEGPPVKKSRFFHWLCHCRRSYDWFLEGQKTDMTYKNGDCHRNRFGMICCVAETYYVHVMYSFHTRFFNGLSGEQVQG